MKNPLEIYENSNPEEIRYNIKSAYHINADEIIIYKFVASYFQDNYDMKIYYENGQSITFTKKKNTGHDDTFDKFPPMMFCKAGSDSSRRYLCCFLEDYRRGITLDHPFTQWLIKNAIKIESHFPRQFQQIVDSLCNAGANKIIKTVSGFRRQLMQLNFNHGIDLDSLPELTNEDFWDPRNLNTMP